MTTSLAGRKLPNFFAFIVSTLLLVACQGEKESGKTADGSESVTGLNATVLEKDPVSFTWNDTWLTRLGLDASSPLDLSAQLAGGGVLAFDVNVQNMAKGDLKLVLNCGADCVREADVTMPLRELAGQGWQSRSISLSCLAHEGDDFAHITTPFGLKVAGTGEVTFANIRFLASGNGNIQCVPYEQLSVTPATLNANWAIDWWMPRHKEKLARIQQGNVDLIMIGDSITHGWEDAGKEVWEQYYAGRNAVNLGFSGDRTENVLWRLEHGEVEGISPKVAVVMIGTNNAGHRREDPELTAKGISRIVDELKTRLPQTRILLLGIFPRGEYVTDELRQLNRKTNTIIEDLAKQKQVTYLNINKEFLDSDGKLSKDIMPDLLHPNAKGYKIWAAAMEPTLAELLAE